MISLKPFVHRTIWGGSRLSELIDSEYNDIGHLYLINGHFGLSNVITDGVFAGQTLYEIFPKSKKEWGMDRYDEFPLTIAMVDATESLSIQVHPDAETAECIEKVKLGKEESWFFLCPPESGWIYCGCECDDMQTLREAVNSGSMEEITGQIAIQRGDYICIKAGTLHAMTAGSIAMEVEFGSDITYRFFDYHRTDSNGNERELHVNKALKAIHLGNESLLLHEPMTDWVSEDNYDIRFIHDENKYINNTNTVQCMVNIDSGRSWIIMQNEIIDLFSSQNYMIVRLHES